MARYYAGAAAELELCCFYEWTVSSYMQRVGLGAWIPHFEAHLPTNMQSVELLRATTEDDLRRMGEAANMRLDAGIIEQVLTALKKHAG